jgi:hypothetical protein
MRLRAFWATVLLVAAMLVGVPSPALAWNGWSEPSGYGRTRSGPAIVPGTGEIIVRGTDIKIYWNRRSGSGWTGWDLVPGDGRALSAPAAVRTAGILWIAVRGTDDYVWYQSQQNGQWSGWKQADVQVGVQPGTISRPALADTGAIQPAMFIRGKLDNKIYQYQFGNGLWP